MRETDQVLDTSPVVSVEEAARIARVSPQTIDRWLDRGWLPNLGSADHPLISPDDIPIVAAAPPSADLRPTNGDERALAMTTNGSHSSLVRQDDLAHILLLIRDAWLAPYVDQIAELSRTVGRLEAERTVIPDQVEAIVAGLAQAEQAQAQVAEQTEQITALADDVATLQRDVASPDPDLEALRQEIVELRRLVSVAWTAIEQRAREDQQRTRQSRRWWQR